MTGDSRRVYKEMDSERLEAGGRDPPKDETIEKLNEDLLRFMESLDKDEMSCLKNVDLEVETFRKMFEFPE